MEIEIPNDVYSALKEFGLTDYETRAFVDLIVSGKSNAKEISSRTNIPYSRIYDVLVNLESLGWVKVLSGRPMEYAAERPSLIAKLAKKQLEEKYVRIESALIEKLDPLYQKKTDVVDSTPIWIINGNVKQKVIEKIENAKEKIQLLLRKNNEPLLNDFYNQLLNAHTLSNVKIEVILTSDITIEEKKIWRKLVSIAEVHQIDGHSLFDGMIIDEKQAILFLTSFFDIQVQEENMAFWISENKLMRYFNNYFRLVKAKATSFTL